MTSQSYFSNTSVMKIQKRNVHATTPGLRQSVGQKDHTLSCFNILEWINDSETKQMKKKLKNYKKKNKIKIDYQFKLLICRFHVGNNAKSYGKETPQLMLRHDQFIEFHTFCMSNRLGLCTISGLSSLSETHICCNPSVHLEK